MRGKKSGCQQHKIPIGCRKEDKCERESSREEQQTKKKTFSAIFAKTVGFPNRFFSFLFAMNINAN